MLVYTGQCQMGAAAAANSAIRSVYPQKEWAFLCACASPTATRDEIDSFLDQSLNWDALLPLAELHSVQGLVARRLAPLETAAIPATARERLQTQIRAQHLFTLSLTADLFRILQCFSDAHVDTVLVKGPVLSQVAYGDPSVRSYVDLDLLVCHRNIQSASNRMMEIGFHPEVSEAIIRAGKIPGEYLFRRPGTQRVIELHTEHSFAITPSPCESTIFLPDVGAFSSMAEKCQASAWKMSSFSCAFTARSTSGNA